jgi:hypothetical protein
LTSSPQRVSQGVSSRVRAARPLAAAALALLASLAPGAARAQGFGAPPSAPPAASKPPPGTPETHAAPGGDEASPIQTQEPTLPAEPLAIPPQAEGKIRADADRDLAIRCVGERERRFYGLYYSERCANGYQFRTAIPLWAERKQGPDAASIFGPLYYRRRSPEVDADVVFPLLWRLRNGRTHTTIVGPFMHRERDAAPAPTADDPKPAPGRHDNWLAPLFFEGSGDDGSGYLHIPPLLTFTQHTDRSGFNLVGPLFCKWKGGPACDARSTDEVDLGLAPLYFYGRDRKSEYELIPPLLHYYSYSDVGDRSFNLWGPLLWERSRDTDVFNVMPFYWHSSGKNEEHTTLFPLLHYGYEGSSSLLATPLFVSATGDKGEKTFATWGYARYRGRTELDMWTPLYWQYRDPDIGLDRKILFPFYYRSTSPRSDDIAILPFYAHLERPAISETWWITPFFRHTKDLTGWETDLHPLFYFGRENHATHLVVAPFLWDFASPSSRSTLILPFYYRFSDATTLSQLALNTYYRERRVRGGTDWEVHVFPVFSYGESPTGHWWNFLYGLAGYTREGTMSKMRTLYIPITLSE